MALCPTSTATGPPARGRVLRGWATRPTTAPTGRPPSPPTAHLELSSDPAFGGRPERLNPEQLLLMAASSCQLLSFLAVAARARLDVIAYEDEAEAMMPDDDRRCG